MALTEISPNVRRNGSHRSKLQAEAVPSLKMSSSMAPRGVQSMLRTTTETGDIGQFSVRPSRLPRSASRLAMARPRSGSFDSSFTGPRHPKTTPHQLNGRGQGPRQMRSYTNLPRPDTIRSNLTSYHQNPRSRMRTSRPYPPGLERPGSPSLGSRSLYSHRSLMTLRSQRDYRSMHSNSPGGLAAQMRRPGQRAPSPAFSDVLGYGLRTRPPYSRAGSVASSPSSAYPMRHRNLGYVPDMNNSFTSFARLPSPALPLSYAGTARSRPQSRTSTPVSFGDPRGASSVSLASAMRGLPRSPTGSSAPAYYDYSESFVGQYCLLPDGDRSVSSLPFGIDQTIHEDGPPPTHPRAHMPFGIRPGSVYNPAELPTSHNRTLSEASKSTRSVISPAVVPKRTSSLVPPTLITTEEVCLDSTSWVEVMEAVEVESPSAGSENEPSKENDPRRASIVSNASRLSSHSSTFFPNASRSPRNLTSLAARVHSPDLDQVRKQASFQRREHRMENNAKVVCSTTSGVSGPILQSWKLPSLNFRPFSLNSSIQCPSDRPRTSSGVVSRACTEIMSPTPERPMSSQSRKRFSKILDIDDNYPDPEFRAAKRSFNSLNFLNLRKVDEMAESNYPARFSIPPFSTLKATTVSDSAEPNREAVTLTPEIPSSQTTNPQRSTVDSLLERHIEALGLMTEKGADEDAVPVHGADFHSKSGPTDDTFDALAMGLATKTVTRSHSLATAPSSATFSLGSPERRRLIPRRLFASADMSTSKLPSPQSAPQFPTSPQVRGSESRRLSYGWQTLASSSQLNSMPSFPRMPASHNDRDTEEVTEKSRRFRVRRRSASSLGLTYSSRRQQSIEDISRLEEEVKTRTRPRDTFERQASHRRRQRVRLKLKHESQSLASIKAKELQGSPSNDYTRPATPVPQADAELESDLVNGLAELDSRPVVFPHDKNTELESIRDHSTSPKIPHRWSSLTNVVQQPIKRSIDVVRKPSVRTMRSHPSISSLAEPINSTRFAGQSPHMISQISISLLAPPDLGPPLHASTLDLSIPYAPVPSTVRPTLRETQSFFSDDSSGLQNKPGISGGTGTLRRKLGLHSLRNVIPASPRTSAIQRAFSAKAQGSCMQIHHSCNNIARGKKSFDEDVPLDGTVGMSDFAYRKRKMVQKVKDWWMRQCVQKTIANTLRRKKPTESRG